MMLAGLRPSKPPSCQAEISQIEMLRRIRMRLTEDKIRRIAESLHDGLEQQGMLEYKDARGAKPGTGRALRIKAIYDFIIADLRKEEEIDAEVERILDTYSRGLKGTERDVLYRKHKEEVARKKGYIL